METLGQTLAKNGYAYNPARKAWFCDDNLDHEIMDEEIDQKVSLGMNVLELQEFIDNRKGR
jgi:hypothetical protein